VRGFQGHQEVECLGRVGSCHTRFWKGTECILYVC
jgi:hypothetical protein